MVPGFYIRSWMIMVGPSLRFSLLMSPSEVLKRYQAPPRCLLIYLVKLAGDDDISGAGRPIGLRILHFHKEDLHIHIRALVYIHPAVISSHCYWPLQPSSSSCLFRRRL